MGGHPPTFLNSEDRSFVMPWYRLDPETVGIHLGTEMLRGLDQAETVARLETHGRNILITQRGRSLWRIVRDQFAGKLVVVLLLAAGVSLVVGSIKETIAICATVLLNAAIGFIQEYRAERALAALRRLVIPMVPVFREGMLEKIPASLLVPGDIVHLEAGHLVPADGRIIEAVRLGIHEGMLTGEADPEEKHPDIIPGEGELALGDRNNMAFMGTSVVRGRGKMMVTATGGKTELGRVAHLIQKVRPAETPFQRCLNRLGQGLAWAALFVVIGIFSFGLLIGEDWKLMLMTSVSIAVAIIPEGLPAVVAILLALVAQRMRRANALIRRLPAVEALGSVTVICADKTGTLTENRMAVTVLDLAGHRLEFSEELNRRMPATAVEENASLMIRNEPCLSLLLMGAALCTDARLNPDARREGHFRALGDPVEGALVVAAARYGLLKDRLDAAYPRIAEVPFDSERKRMTTVHRIADCSAWIGECVGLEPNPPLVFTKGGVDSLLPLCAFAWDSGRSIPMDENRRLRIATVEAELAQNGMRVIGVAFRQLTRADLVESEKPEQFERDMVFIGLIGLRDPPRAGVEQAIAACRRAGIRPVMITGDHPITARRIAGDLGIINGGNVITGSELEQLPQGQVDAFVQGGSVFARVSAGQKLRIVESLQRRGQVVAMTGDGVNDAPALRAADIGVAMGLSGSDVAKEAASMVLLDDNFKTIVLAVEEGRTINDNIQRFLKFSLAGNIGKVLLVFLGPLLGMPLPLLPFQILWLNLVTDGALGLGIGVEPAEADSMRRPPQPATAPVLTGYLWCQVVWLGMLLGGTNLLVAYWAFTSNQPGWQTIVMSTVVLLQIIEAHAGRSARLSVFKLNPLSNRVLPVISIFIILVQAAVIYMPALHDLFGTQALSARQLIVPLGAGLFVLVIVEGYKWLGRKGNR